MTIEIEEKRNIAYPESRTQERFEHGEPFELVLEKLAVHHLDGDARGTEIACLQGILWVTQQDDGQDYILKSGDSLVVSHRGRVVIEAISDAILRITPDKYLPADRIKRNSIISRN
ncbi:MAG: DUF2917 domain-containing protein [Anaerolineales bacterium]